MFQNCLDDDAMTIYHSIQFATTKPEQTVQEIIDVLDEYMIYVTNKRPMNILNFNRENGGGILKFF